MADALSVGWRRVDGKIFHAAMQEFAGSAAVVSVGSREEITAFTGTSIAPISAYPARILACVSQSSGAAGAFRRHSHFAINVLGEWDRSLARCFGDHEAREATRRYYGSRWTTMATGAPILESALVAVDCDVEEVLARHDYEIVIGRVRAVRFQPGPRPLIRWKGEYYFLGEALDTDQASMWTP